MNIEGSLSVDKIEDIAAFKVHDAARLLPHSTFHVLSCQEATQISAGNKAAFFGFSVELSKENQWHKAVFPFVDLLRIVDTVDTNEKHSRPEYYFVTDLPEGKGACDPHGMR